MTDPLLEYLKSFGEWEREYLSQPVEYKIDPPLVNFEQVLGRKFNCGDCKDNCFINNVRFCGCCGYGTNIIKEDCFKLSEKTREILNHLMREGDDLGIDVHPRYFLFTLTKLGKTILSKKFKFHDGIYKLYPKKYIKLELIL